MPAAIPPTVPGILNEGLSNTLQKLFLGSLAAGVAGRGLYGVIREVNEAKKKPVSGLPSQFPVYVEDESKLAATKQALFPELVASRLKTLAGTIGNKVGDFFTPDAAANLDNPNMWSHPLAISGMMLAGGAGVGGGWKLTDWLMEKRRSSQRQAELDAAKADYEQSLLPQGAKAASELGQALDAAYEAATTMQKQATVGDWVPGPILAMMEAGAFSRPGLTGDIALGAMTPVAVMAGMSAYSSAASARDKKKLLDRAVQDRTRRQLTSGPVYAYPQTVGETDDEGGENFGEEPA